MIKLHRVIPSDAGKSPLSRPLQRNIRAIRSRSSRHLCMVVSSSPPTSPVCSKWCSIWSTRTAPASLSKMTPPPLMVSWSHCSTTYSKSFTNTALFRSWNGASFEYHMDSRTSKSFSHPICSSRNKSMTQVSDAIPRWYSNAYFSNMGSKSGIGNMLSESLNRLPRLRTFSAMTSYG